MSCFLNFIVLLICLLCSFIQGNYWDNYARNQRHSAQYNNTYNKEITFRVIRGTPAKLGDVPYQVRNKHKYSYFLW